MSGGSRGPTCYETFIKDHSVYHIDIEDDNVLEFIRDFNLIDCTNDKIDEFISFNDVDCSNNFNASFDTNTLANIIMPKCPGLTITTIYMSDPTNLQVFFNTRLTSSTFQPPSLAIKSLPS